MSDEARREKQTAAAINWMTILMIPVGLGLAGWFATEFDSMRVGQIHMQDKLDQISLEVDHHSKQLDYIWNEIAKQLKQHASNEP